MWFRFVFLLFIFFSTDVYSQKLFLPLNRYLHNRYNESLNRKEVGFHTSVKPYLQSELDSVVAPDSIYGFHPYKIGIKSRIGRIWNGFINDHLVHVDTGDFELTIDPLFNFEIGRDIQNDDKAYVNTRGILVTGSIGKNFSFFSSFYENQAVFISYIDEYIDTNKVVPGQGESKPFKARGHDYSMASGYISYSPSRYFNFQFGHGKNFIGDGYRSLLLSDNAFNYPFLKITTTIWKIKYVNLFAQFQDIRVLNASVLGRGYPKKFGSFHYLSWNVSKRFQLGLFESIIWQGSDSTHNRGFDFNYLNPVIFYRSVEFSLGSPDNALIGLNGKFKVTDKFYVFGQFILDDFKLSEFRKEKSSYHQKYGFQLGMKMMDLLKIPRLSLHSEFNYVMPYTYAHRLSAQNYGHYNQALAHPLGANFKESVSFLSYQYRRFFIETKFLYAIYGADSLGKNFGKNIYAPEYDLMTSPLSSDNTVGQGVKTNLIHAGVKLAYIVNPKLNMRIEVNYVHRHESSALQSRKTDFISLGIKTALNNFYYDF